MRFEFDISIPFTMNVFGRYSTLLWLFFKLTKYITVNFVHIIYIVLVWFIYLFTVKFRFMDY